MKSFSNFPQPKYPTIQTKYYNNSYQQYMPLVLADFYLTASRKSYLPCGQSYDVASYDSIIGALTAGARLINLDIYPDQQNPDKPVVRNTTMMAYYGQPLDLGKTFSIIARDAWKTSAADYPLILYLGINSMNPLLLQQITDAIKKYFGTKLINRKYGYNGRGGLSPLAQAPIADLLGRITIITDKYPTINSLNEYIHGTVGDTINLHEWSSDDSQYGGIVVKNGDVKNLVNTNRTGITVVNTPNTLGLTNVHNPKSDLTNPDAANCFQYGCQWIMMNYQLFDANMADYVKYFADSGPLKLKPDTLRNIPIKPAPIVPQNTQLYYGPRTAQKEGWFSLSL